MKRLLMLFAVLLLFGCSENDVADQDELISFIKEYNEEVDFLNGEDNDVPEVDKITDDEIGLPEREERYWQKLLEIKTELLEESFSVTAKYDKDKVLSGYQVSSHGDTSNITKEEVFFSEQGIIAPIMVAKVLGLNSNTYDEHFNLALHSNEPSIEYIDSGYKVSYLVLSDLGMLVVNFDKIGD